MAKAFSRHFGDNVMNLLCEIDPGLVGEHFVLPKLQRLRGRLQITRTVGITHYLRYMQATYSSISSIDPSDPSGFSLTVRDLDTSRLVSLVEDHFSHLSPTARRHYSAPEAQHIIELIEEYGEEIDGRPGKSVSLAGLSYRNPFIRAIADTPGWFSLSGFQSLFEIEKALAVRTRADEGLLASLLVTSPSQRSRRP